MAVHFTGSLEISGSINLISGSVNIAAGNLTVDGAPVAGGDAFPYTGSAGITGSLVVNGTSQASIIAGKQPSGIGGAVVGNRVLVNNSTIYSILPGGTSTERANFPYLRTGGLGANQGDENFTYYYQDLNIGYENSLGGTKAPSIKITRDQVGSDLDTAPYYTVISDNVTLADSAVTTFGNEIWRANGRAHVLTVATGSFLAREGVSLGTNISNRHIITGSVNVTGSLVVNGSSVGAAYKVYSALVTVDGSGVSAEVLENTLGETITWSNPLNGVLRATATGTPFTAGKTWITSGGFNNGGMAMIVTSAIRNTAPTSEVEYRFFKFDGTISFTPFMTRYSIEIRVYP